MLCTTKTWGFMVYNLNTLQKGGNIQQQQQQQQQIHNN